MDLLKALSTVLHVHVHVHTNIIMYVNVCMFMQFLYVEHVQHACEANVLKNDLGVLQPISIAGVNICIGEVSFLVCVFNL